MAGIATSAVEIDKTIALTSVFILHLSLGWFVCVCTHHRPAEVFEIEGIVVEILKSRRKMEEVN